MEEDVEADKESDEDSEDQTTHYFHIDSLTTTTIGCQSCGCTRINNSARLVK